MTFALFILALGECLKSYNRLNDFFTLYPSNPAAPISRGGSQESSKLSSVEVETRNPLGILQGAEKKKLHK